MSTLHTVNKSPFESNALTSCITHALDGSSILLFEDGVYGALAQGAFAENISESKSRCHLYVLGPDLKARGLDDSLLLSDMNVVDYVDFVRLAAEHDKVQAWL